MHGRRRRGITLVELLVAAVILGFAAPAILGAQAAAFGGANSLRRRMVALSLAQSTLETARWACEAGFVATGTLTSTTNVAGITYETQVQVTNPAYNLALVEVRTSWTERRNGRDVADDVKLGAIKRTAAFP